jgi:hypothetical protein
VQTAYSVVQRSMHGAMSVVVSITVYSVMQRSMRGAMAVDALIAWCNDRLTYGGFEYIESIESQIVTVY